MADERIGLKLDLGQSEEAAKRLAAQLQSDKTVAVDFGDALKFLSANSDQTAISLDHVTVAAMREYEALSSTTTVMATASGGNLLPAFPMDGGRVFRALLAMRLPYARATRLAANVGQMTAIGFGLIGLSGHAPILLFIAIFVWIGAEAEARQVAERAALQGVSIREAMITEFHTLEADESLGRAADLLLSGTQQDFPVAADGDAVFHVLTRGDLMTGLSQRGRDGLVRDFAPQRLPTVDVNGSLPEATVLLRSRQAPCLQVVDRGRVVGLLTLENVGELLMIRAALGETGEAEAAVKRPVEGGETIY